MRRNKKTLEIDMRVFMALALFAAVLAGGAYSVVRSIEHPVAEGNYFAHSTGASSRLERTDRVEVGFDE